MPQVYRGNSVIHIHICMCTLLFSHLSRVLLFVTPWTAARQAPLSSTLSQSLLKFVSVESVMLSNHLTLCRPLLLLPSIFPSIKVFPMSQLFASGKPWKGHLHICVFSITGYYKILNIVSCAIQYILIVYLFYIYSSVYMLIPNS